MLSDTNLRTLAATGLWYIVGDKLPEVPYLIKKWHQEHPDQTPPDQLVLTQSWTRGIKGNYYQEVIYYQYREGRAKRTLKGVEEQIRKAKAAIAGKTPIKKNRFIKLEGATKTLNTQLEHKARTLAGWKAYVPNIPQPSADFVISAYHQLWQIEKSFRMSKSDLAARPIYHHKRESIEAHLTIVFAALAVARWLEATTGTTIKQLVRTLRRYRTITIKAGKHLITAEDPLPPKPTKWLQAIQTKTTTH